MKKKLNNNKNNNNNKIKMKEKMHINLLQIILKCILNQETLNYTYNQVPSIPIKLH